MKYHYKNTLKNHPNKLIIFKFHIFKHINYKGLFQDNLLIKLYFSSDLY